MGKYTLKEKDWQILEEIIKITVIIYNIYNDLYEIELRGQKDTHSYKLKIEQLMYEIEKEKKLYKDASLTNAKIEAFKEYLVKQLSLTTFNIDNSLIIKNPDKPQNIFARRIIFTLNNQIKFNGDQIEKVLSKELIQFITVMSKKEEKQGIYMTLRSSVEIEKALERDRLNMFLSFLEEYINDEKFGVLKDKLLETKYNIAFINTDIEKDLIVDNFNVQNAIYLNSKFNADILGINNKIYSFLKNIYGLDLARSHIYKLSEIRDSEYIDNDKIIDSVYRQCFIRSALLLIDEDIRANKDEIIKNQILNGNEISYSSIMEAFEKIEKDKEKHYTISFKAF